MSQYLLLIHDSEEEWDASPTERHEEHHAGHRAFQQKHEKAIVSSGYLKSTRESAYVRKTGKGKGKFIVTDGVFVETKEALGGWYVVEAADLAEAADIATDVPFFGDAVIQIRPMH
jgi:hypothetical protein